MHLNQDLEAGLKVIRDFANDKMVPALAQAKIDAAHTWRQAMCIWVLVYVGLGVRYLGLLHVALLVLVLLLYIS